MEISEGARTMNRRNILKAGTAFVVALGSSIAVAQLVDPIEGGGQFQCEKKAGDPIGLCTCTGRLDCERMVKKACADGDDRWIICEGASCRCIWRPARTT
jgi:hypothetical protein